MKIFAIYGYWKDDGVVFHDYLVAEFDQTPDGYDDMDMFFYGLSESDIIDAIERVEDTVHDFVITDYSIYDEV